VTNIDDPRYVKALAHPTRIRLLAMLRERRASPNELAERLGLPLGTVAYHVRTLRNLGVIKLVATAKRRGATEHYYEATEHPRFTDEAWAAVSPIGKQRMLSAMLQQAGDYAAGSAAAGGFDRADAVITRHSLQLDERGWKDLTKLARKFLADMDKIEGRAQKRLEAGESGEALDVGVILMAFEALPLSGHPPPERERKRSARRSRSASQAG
jgi:DNA-binding transcriptional ArsR family regulator